MSSDVSDNTGVKYQSNHGWDPELEIYRAEAPNLVLKAKWNGVSSLTIPIIREDFEAMTKMAKELGWL